jgi:hypothetical protein
MTLGIDGKLTCGRNWSWPRKMRPGFIIPLDSMSCTGMRTYFD